MAATLDTKGQEAQYICDLLEAAGLPVTLADLSTSGSPPASTLENVAQLSASPHRNVISAGQIA
ncbi:MAG TPA: Tm-1-like ATP-binding domain-containing protein, partial [Terriglobales bacterium]|nr:Tm-1-like ATP-binding domain-containing protein [Terriglobales bacterium]